MNRAPFHHNVSGSLRVGSNYFLTVNTTPVYIYSDANRTVLATIYGTATGSAVGNPLTPDSSGEVECYLPSGSVYYIRVGTTPGNEEFEFFAGTDNFPSLAYGYAEVAGQSSPGTAPAGSARLYFDAATNRMRLSENGGAFVPLMGSGAGGTLPITDGDPYTAGSTTGYGSIGVVDDTATAVLSEQAAGLMRLTPYRATHVNLRRQDGTEIGTVTNPMYIQGGSGGSNPLDNSGYVAGTTTGTPIMGAVDDTGTTAASENALGILRITPQRAAHINLRNLAGTEIGTSSTPVRVDPTGTTTQPVSVAVPTTATGASIYHVKAAATTNGASVKASAGNVYGYYFFNAAATIKYLKLYNKASSPTVGTDTPVAVFPLPAGAAGNVGLAFGLSFATGIAVAITGALADSDTTALVANDVVLNLYYK